MEIISATEAKQNFAALLDRAQKAPILIRRQKRDVAFLVSSEEYERYRKLQLQEFQALVKDIGLKAQQRGLTEEKLAEILAEDD